MDYGIFDALVQYGTSERLDEVIRENVDYDRLNDEYREAYQEFEDTDLTETQRRMVIKLLDLYAEKISVYTETAYVQGIHDAVKLLQDMKVL